MNSLKINKFIDNYKPIKNKKLKVNKKSNDLLNEEQKNKIINNTLEYINCIISIFENHKIDYTLY